MANATTAARVQKISPWRFGGLKANELAKLTWEELNEDDILNRAAQLAYFFFFALFPLLISLTAILGLVAGPGSPLVSSLADYVTRAMPGSAATIVHQTLQEAVRASGGGKITFGIALALVSASSGMGAMMSALNGVFGVREGRSMVRQRAIAFGLTIAVGILICLALVVVVYGGTLANKFFGGALHSAWNIAQYPVAIFFLLLSYSVVYYFAPNVEHPEWHWVTPGAVVGVVLWIIVSFGLRVYLHFFNSYSTTYGSLGAVMILLLWFYVTGLAFLMGGEINSIIEHAAMGGTENKQGEQQGDVDKAVKTAEEKSDQAA